LYRERPIEPHLMRDALQVRLRHAGRQGELGEWSAWRQMQ
jgi:hypothetical protein